MSPLGLNPLIAVSRFGPKSIDNSVSVRHKVNENSNRSKLNPVSRFGLNPLTAVSRSVHHIFRGRRHFSFVSEQAPGGGSAQIAESGGDAPLHFTLEHLQEVARSRQTVGRDEASLVLQTLVNHHHGETAPGGVHRAYSGRAWSRSMITNSLVHWASGS